MITVRKGFYTTKIFNISAAYSEPWGGGRGVKDDGD
jgi:hypothetical protein